MRIGDNNLLIVILTGLGLCIGSFLNCVVYRLNHNLSPLRGRSICPKCRRGILWQDNLPLISFILLKGRCRWCHSPISWQYPLVELATAILTPVTFWLTNKGPAFSWQFSLAGQAIFNLFITYLLIIIFVSDLRYYTIPDWVVLPGVILSFCYTLFILRDPRFILAGLGGASFFAFLVWITRGKGMGIGDIKLAALMGLVLGWPGIAVAVSLAFLTGAVVGVILIFGHQKRLNSQVPFGPFLAAATWVVLFFGGY